METSLGCLVALKERGEEGILAVVPINYNEVGEYLLDFRQGKECTFLFVDFGNVCTWRWEGEDIINELSRYPFLVSLLEGKELFIICFTPEGTEAERS